MELLLLALHGGMFVSAGGNNTSGAGERIEAEALAQEAAWFSFGVVGAYGHFTGTDPDDEGPGPFLNPPVHIISGGLRAYLQTTYVFLGAGVFSEWRDDYGFHQGFGEELVVGGNLARIGNYRVQLLLGASLARPTGDNIVDVTFQLGVQRVVR